MKVMALVPFLLAFVAMGGVTLFLLKARWI